jgi:Transglutaminase-like superfamily
MSPRRQRTRDDRVSDLSRRYIGPRWFGPAYAAMMRLDPHARGSVDRELLATSVGLDARSAIPLYRPPASRRTHYRKGTRPILDALARGVAPPASGVEAGVRSLIDFVADHKPEPPRDIGSLRFGGTEEEIIARGSEWCTDLARVACALFQVAGFPSRMVFLADTSKAYSGHALLEVYRQNKWGAADPLDGVVYRGSGGAAASTWELMAQPELIALNSRGRGTPHARRGQFRTAAIAEYRLGRRGDHNYRISGINPYYRSILRMSERGWPGGLRWLHGEDDSDLMRDARVR